MTRLLDDAALGDLAAILPGTALADGVRAGDIRPDPDAQPKPHPRRDLPEFEHPREEPQERAPSAIKWNRSGISVGVRAVDDGLTGDKMVGYPTHRISPGVVKVSPEGRVRMNVYFHVDAEFMSRPQPFQPPQVGIQWYFTPDGGSPTKTAISWDAAPTYLGPGIPLAPTFDGSVTFSPTTSGWLTISARIDDPEGTAEFDDTIRILVPAPE